MMPALRLPLSHDPLAQLGALDPQADTGHARRVAELVVRLARVVRAPLCLDELYCSACLHDLGKVDLHHIDMLPRSLEPDERRLIETHADIGARMLHFQCRWPERPAGYVRHHHERYDGQGYPDRLTGEVIPLGARLISVADAFDALVNDRPYRAAWCAADARAYLVAHAGTRFDPQLVQAFDSLSCA